MDETMPASEEKMEKQNPQTPTPLFRPHATGYAEKEHGGMKKSNTTASA